MGVFGKQTSKQHFVLFLVLFNVAWAMKGWIVVSFPQSNLRDVIDIGIKLLVWLVPLALYIRYINGQNLIEYLNLKRFMWRGVIWAVIVSLLMIAYFSIMNLLLHGELRFRVDLPLKEWLTVLIVGITEEPVYRGFVLRKLMGSMKFIYANLITSVLFVMIHFPIWFFYQKISFSGFLMNVMGVFLFSLMIGFIYKRSNSLWAVIMIHSLYDLLTYVAPF